VGESTDGTVRATVNGEYRLVDIQIDQAVLASADKRAIEKKIIFAVNDAVDKTKEYAAEEMAKLTGGLKYPRPEQFPEIGAGRESSRHARGPISASRRGFPE
jgi:DNA-binding protein YbaB